MSHQGELLRAALASRYRVDRELGRGAMSLVFLAQDLANGSQVAVKVVRPELTAILGPERFHREIELLKRLRHPSIVPLLDSGSVGSVLYLVMPYVAGENLRSKLEREGHLSIETTLAVAGDVAAALDYAHGENVIHRDIKPENILLEGDRAVVCDFGLARALDRAAVEPISSSGLVLGTPMYMSPEQAMGDPDLTAASDIYAMGCVVYEMLTGEPPFGGSSAQAIIARQLGERPRSIRAVRPEIPNSVEQAVFGALAKRRGDRPASGRLFVKRLAGELR